MDVPSLRTLLIQLFKRFPINFGLIAAGEMFEVLPYSCGVAHRNSLISDLYAPTEESLHGSNLNGLVESFHNLVTNLHPTGRSGLNQQFVSGGAAHVIDQCGSETDNAGAARFADARVDDAVRSGVEEMVCQILT